ncbi:cytochrome b/b6 domain-containing protein [Bosea sp. CS1GBMeth4]|uniref:cytochrome b n=1 Tax=Bosea sp. CS1GBMeth4 TaxID=1892849 RepID=UPI001644B592|nr:cytochrome b/b6 domain-containing protein [Bosea sp. CS1GBMeth4]
MSLAIPEARGGAAVPAALPVLAQVLHWLTAALVLGLFVSGVVMTQIGEGPTADLLYLCHRTAGILLLGTVLIRIGYRLSAHLAGRWHRQVASRAVHALLYLALLAVPLLGWAGSSGFGARRLLLGLSLPQIGPEEAGLGDALLTGHAWLAFALVALVVLHIGVAIGDYLARDANAEAGQP